MNLCKDCKYFGETCGHESAVIPESINAISGAKKIQQKATPELNRYWLFGEQYCGKEGRFFAEKIKLKIVK